MSYLESKQKMDTTEILTKIQELNTLIGSLQTNVFKLSDDIKDMNSTGGNTLSGTLIYDSNGLQPKKYLNSHYMPSVPYIFYYGSAVVYNDEIHILGGYSTNTYTNHYKWDGSSWTSVSSLPYNFYGGSAVVYNDEIHILGSDLSGSTKHYKWDGSSWTSVSTLPCYFYYGSAVVLNNEIHILYNTNHYKWNGSSWTSVSTLPYYFGKGSAVVYNNEIHILGGNSTNTYTKHYKWDGSSWTSVSTLPYDFYNGCAVVYNNEIHILGSGSSSNYSKYYKWNRYSWTSVSTLPYNFYQGSAVVYDNEIHILGGYSNSTSHYILLSCFQYRIYSKKGMIIKCDCDYRYICGISKNLSQKGNELTALSDDFVSFRINLTGILYSDTSDVSSRFNGIIIKL